MKCYNFEPLWNTHLAMNEAFLPALSRVKIYFRLKKIQRSYTRQMKLDKLIACLGVLLVTFAM